MKTTFTEAVFTGRFYPSADQRRAYKLSSDTKSLSTNKKIISCKLSQYDYSLYLIIILFEPDKGFLKIKQKDSDFKTEGDHGHYLLFSDYLLFIFPAL